MTSQLRMYTINRGMMDQWVKLFTETLVPMQEKHGIKIEGMWVSEDSTQFIWIHTYGNSTSGRFHRTQYPTPTIMPGLDLNAVGLRPAN